MMISTNTIIIFHLPEEAEEEKMFRQNNDLSQFQCLQTTVATSYIYKKTFVTNIKGESNDGNG